MQSIYRSLLRLQVTDLQRRHLLIWKLLDRSGLLDRRYRKILSYAVRDSFAPDLFHINLCVNR